MKKLLLKLAVLCALVFGTLFAIILLPGPQNTYVQAILDKHQRLMETAAPRLVLVGGSNLAFGIDSEMLQNGLGMLVVNTGLHAGFGLGRMLDDVAPFLQSGDTLVIAPEYSHFTSEWDGGLAAWDLVSDTRNFSLLISDTFIGPEYQRLVDSWNSDSGAELASDTRSLFLGTTLYGLPSAFPEYARGKLLALLPRPLTPLAYTRDGFNEYGDYIKHFSVENQPITPNQPLDPLNPKYLARFFQFVAAFTGSGIRVILTYPSYEEVSFYNMVNRIHELDALIREREDLTVISIPEDYCFPAAFFYDTVYHLNEHGRAIRSEQLLHDLLASGLFPLEALSENHKLSHTLTPLGDE
ncbi:MAG: hypothetical protein LBJ41_06360 [Treponema sp.]|jgi:hypothetical protein|nr:hypothetical protein [Treponema sp.]